jgi:ATP-dependent Clp protease ATP-binding subunit ClpB
LNRLDDTVVFRPLSKDDLLRIVDIRLKELGRLLAPRKLTLDVTDAAKLRLVDLSYEPALGARPLKRTLVKELQDPLSHALLSARLPAGGQVKVDVVAGALVLETVAS